MFFPTLSVGPVGEDQFSSFAIDVCRLYFCVIFHHYVILYYIMLYFCWGLTAVTSCQILEEVQQAKWLCDTGG